MSWNKPSIEIITKSLPSLALFLVAVVVIAVDQWSKRIILRTLDFNESWSPIPALSRLFRITHTTNSGAAFGIFPERGQWFIFIALVVVVVILVYYRHLPPGSWLVRISLGLQLGGAIGNLIDRITNQGEVIDFIDVGFWPIFNVADSAIVTGVMILAYALWKEERKRMAEEAATQEPAGEEAQT